LEESLGIFQSVNDAREVALTLNNLGHTLVYCRQLDRARCLLEQSLSLHEELGDSLLVSYNQNNLGLCALRQGSLDEARTLFVQSLPPKLEAQNWDAIPYGLEGLAEVAAARGEPERAARLLGAAAAQREAVGHPRCPPSERAHYERILTAVRETLGEAVFELVWLAGCSMTVEQAVAFAVGEAPSA
jgi:non-specific serine/threonine protein kinase